MERRRRGSKQRRTLASGDESYRDGEIVEPVRVESIGVERPKLASDGRRCLQSDTPELFGGETSDFFLGIADPPKKRLERTLRVVLGDPFVDTSEEVLGKDFTPFLGYHGLVQNELREVICEQGGLKDAHRAERIAEEVHRLGYGVDDSGDILELPFDGVLVRVTALTTAAAVNRVDSEPFGQLWDDRFPIEVACCCLAVDQYERWPASRSKAIGVPSAGVTVAMIAQPWDTLPVDVILSHTAFSSEVGDVECEFSRFQPCEVRALYSAHYF